MKQKKVVLVDDEEDIILYLETALEDAGYLPFAATTVSRGLELIRQERPDLVCLDILMPEESGMSLYQILRGDPELEKIPILITSGLSLSKELKDINYRILPDGTKLPAPDGVAEKPLTAAQLLAKVEGVLSGNHDNHN